MRNRRRKKRFAPGLLLVLLALFFSLIFLTAKLRPMIMEYSVNLVQNVVIQAINQAVNEKISAEKAEYQNLVQLERDGTNHVTALSTDVIKMNSMKTGIVSFVYNRISQLEKDMIQIPLGNIVDEDLLAGIGPDIKVGMSGLGTVQADFISAFTAAGINQTRHSILLEVTANITVLSPGGNKTVEITSRFPITDTVIVGTVPETYTYIDDTQSTLLGKINDYTNLGG